MSLICSCGDCKRCKSRIRLQEFRLRKKGIFLPKITDEELEIRMSNYFNKIKTPDNSIYGLRCCLGDLEVLPG